MNAPIAPKYPVYVPSKGRHESGMTMRFLAKDGCPFILVVEPQERDAYAARFAGPFCTILTLPWSGDSPERRAFCAERGIENGGLVAARNWIREHSIAAGHARHWQLDDNIRFIARSLRGLRIRCDSGPALAACESFVDRYENVGIAGLQYYMFLPSKTWQRFPPFYLNHHVYSCSLIDNRMPHRWRLAYNDDTDICLQVLAAGLCTILFNSFMIHKAATMKVKGGNTADLYQGDGRLRMSRSLERLWPGVVTTTRRFNRPQHRIAYEWKRFDNALVLKQEFRDKDFIPDEHGMKLIQIREVQPGRGDFLAKLPTPSQASMSALPPESHT